MLNIDNKEKFLRVHLCIFNGITGLFGLVVLIWAICGICGITLFSPLWFILGYAILVLYALFAITYTHILYHKRNELDE